MYTPTPNITPNKSPRVTTKRSMPAFWRRSHLAKRCAGVPNEILSFMSNESAHRWRPLRDARITSQGCWAAIRWSGWFGTLFEFFENILRRMSREPGRSNDVRRHMNQQRTNALIDLGVGESLRKQVKGDQEGSVRLPVRDIEPDILCNRFWIA